MDIPRLLLRVNYVSSFRPCYFAHLIKTENGFNYSNLTFLKTFSLIHGYHFPLQKTHYFPSLGLKFPLSFDTVGLKFQ